MSLGFLLRSLFAGVFAVVSFIIASSRAREFLMAHTDEWLTVGFPIALFTGVTIYGLHRSLFYCFVELIFCARFNGGRPAWRWLINESTVSYTVKLWDMDRQSDNESVPKVRARRIFAWADYAHLQYTSAWSIIIGAALGYFTDAPDSKHECCIPLILITILFFAAAFTSDFRLRFLCHCIQDESWCKENGLELNRESVTLQKTDNPGCIGE